MAFSNRLNFATQASIADPETISIADAGTYFTTDNVEAALQETGAQLAQIATLLPSQFNILGNDSDETAKVASMMSAIPATGGKLIFDKTQQITINTTSAIIIDNKINVTIEGLNVIGSSGAVIRISGGSKNITFRDCVFTDVGQVILLFACSDIVVDRCKFIHTGYGIIQQNGYVSDNVKIINCISENMQLDFIEANCEILNPSKNWTVANNHFLGNTNYPTVTVEGRFFGATAVSNIIISGNIVENVSGDAAIHLEDAGGNVLISGNIFKDCRGIGYIYVMHNDKDCIISNNYFESTESDNLTPFVYYYAETGTSEKFIFDGNICIGHSSLNDLLSIIGVETNPKIISNNQFSGFNTLFNNKIIDNVIFANNIVTGFAGLVFKTSAAGYIHDWLIANNKFNTTGNAIDITENTNGNASPTKINIHGNTFNDNVVIHNSHDLLFYGNLIASGKTVVFGIGDWHSLRMLAYGNIVEGVGINPTDNGSDAMQSTGAGTWSPETFTNGWVNFDLNTAIQCEMDSLGFVHLKGLAKNGTIGQAIFTLPTGYRPSEEIYFPVNSAGAFGACFILVTGEVVAHQGSNTYFSLSGITFKP